MSIYRCHNTRAILEIQRVMFWGPMFSGKTTELQNIKRQFTRAGIRAEIFNPAKNTRDNELVSSHDGQTSSCIRFSSVSDVIDAVDRLQLEVVLLEEAQFFPALGELCDELYERAIHVFVATLNQDFTGKPWPHIRDLLHTFEVHQIWSVCSLCGSMKAWYSQKISDAEPDSDGNLIGDEEDYRPLCAACWHKNSQT